MGLTRRHFLAVLAAAGMGAAARPLAATGGAPFHQRYVVDMARKLAGEAYRPAPEAPSDWNALTFDQYRDIRFKAERASWRDAGRMFELQYLPPGYGYRRPVEIALVKGGVAKPIEFNLDDFDFGPLAPKNLSTEGLGLSGFRAHAPLNRADYLDEAFVFHGASYFRAVARGQTYGLSARGLAIDTLKPGEEEFPDFQRFWIETPEPGAPSIRVHALMNSRSIAGAFRFDIVPGEETVFDVSSTLFPRRDLSEVGVAPLTSMFYFGGTGRAKVDDYRPAAHDSDGLLMVTGEGQRLWRPLANHAPRFEVSAFIDRSPQGFGLIQRARNWRDFADLALHYERRPSLWIEPKDDWGPGHVILVEIPVQSEDIDNIVAYWRPDRPLMAGESYRFDYRMLWCAEPTFADARAAVVATRVGPHHEGGRLFVIDFADLEADLTKVDANVWSNAGEIHYPVVQKNPHVDGVRLFFGLRPGDAQTVELGATLMLDGAPLSETWLYRWTT